MSYRLGLALLTALNVLDALSTDIGLRIGALTEMNPVLEAAWHTSPAAFWLLKFSFLAVGILAMGLLKRQAIRIGAMYGAVAVYLVILGMHIAGWVAFFA